MHTYLQRLVDERTSLTEVMVRLAETAATSDRDLSAEEQTQVQTMQARCAEIDRQLVQQNEAAASARGYATLLERIRAEGGEPQGLSQRTGSVAMERTDPGAALEAWLRSDAFLSYPGRGSSAIYEVGDGYLETRAAITTAQLNIEPYHWRPIEHVTTYPLLEVVTRVSVSSGTVEWTEIGPDPEAQVVAEGALKPEATFTLTPKTAALDTLAHWVQITRQALEDATYMRSLIETKLRRGILAKIQTDLAANLVAANAVIPDATDTTSLLNAIRGGIGVVEGNGYTPNAVALNPADFVALDLQAQSALDPATRRQTFWGLRPISVPQLPSGTAYVGDFAAGVTLFDRGSTSVFVSDSHADLFIRNILVILAEARVKSAVTDPVALAECTGPVVAP